ncbi:DUF2264 domain-containing protein [Paenibacillus sp.]|uniref:DUF2264 domain-containing protein n=1 Tax=Paenibacillus sp. TaxID=58172 RepID=UPI002D651579|nr:DUF2264 domain-containing protein [Paenibacillus sp.]HZG86025.1 DUF2264 domain-containing protein [Paenibacillus sp.]
MHRWTLPIQQNPLRTREDVQLAVEQLCRPLLPYVTPGKTRVRLGATSSGCPDHTSELEGFSRLLWGLVPHAAGGADSELWETIRQGIRNGTDPEHEEYWGDAEDYDQKLVEMAAMGFALAHAPGNVWTPLSERERERFARWLRQINEKSLHDCNWLLFRVLVNLGFKRVGLPWDREAMNRCLDRIDDMYLSDGWYADGVKGHCDYYGAFAIHYCGLIYAVLMETEDPDRARLYKERAAIFAKSFIHWFAADGSALPYGRSLTYRFSQSAFWSALAYAGVEPFPMGVIKGIVLRNLRWWVRQPIFQADGTLTIGYTYPNLIMAENYNAPGSPYWALKAFLPLALPPEHPFWQAEELPLPPLPESVVQREPGMIVRRQGDRDHVAVFNAGHEATNDHTHAAAKYEKFVYSNAFGFSVPRAEWGLAQGAFDSMLALSEGDNLYRAKRIAKERHVRDNMIYIKWEPWRDVEVQTWLIVGTPWHVRLHCIRSERELHLADGGFALGIEDRASTAAAQPGVAAISPHGASGIVPLLGGEAKLVYPQANTNLIHARTVIPTVMTKIDPGIHWLASAVYGQPGGEDCLTEWSRVPVLRAEGNEWVVKMSPSASEVRVP